LGGGFVCGVGVFIVGGGVRSGRGPVGVAWGPATGRRYGTGEQIEWSEEMIDVEPPGERRTLLYYNKLAETLAGRAELFVTPESVRRQIETIERARHQTGFL
jgi:scyllo-inositol 2-dehydrogenase (NADP+)